MQRSTYPAGETTASRIKSLVLTLQAKRGRSEADALLSSVKLSHDDLENETRAIGVAVWHKAVEEFASRYGRDALADTWRGVVDPENLGVWMRVLRGTHDPEGAFRQLDGLGGDEVRTSRWETMKAGPGFWQGRVYLTHDPRFERDGLLTLARQAELRAVPVLFGMAPGDVETISTHRSTFATRTGTAGQEFRVSWRLATDRRDVPIASAAGAVLGLGGAAHSMLAAAAGVVAGAVVGAGAGMMLRRDRQRRADAQAQNVRIRALERSMHLRDDQSRKAAGTNEGSVIAGMYRLGAKLGTGASGVIHKAVRLSDNAPVAIKLLRAAVAHDAIASDRLRREAEAMGLAWHPNVVELYDQGALPDGTTYLVMELLEGESLSARLARERPLPLRELLPLALELCDALGAVHAAGVIHRDVKPGNIFLARHPAGAPPDEQRLRVKILDFGIARVEWAETRLTNTEAAVGTPGYMSPEQEEGREIDARSDLFSLGAVLYECLTGIALRPGMRPGDASKDASSDDRSSGVQKASASAPPAWLEVVEKCMAPQPRDRYVDAKALRDALVEAARRSGLDTTGLRSTPPAASGGV